MDPVVPDILAIHLFVPECREMENNIDLHVGVGSGLNVHFSMSECKCSNNRSCNNQIASRNRLDTCSAGSVSEIWVSPLSLAVLDLQMNRHLHLPQ